MSTGHIINTHGHLSLPSSVTEMKLPDFTMSRNKASDKRHSNKNRLRPFPLQPFAKVAAISAWGQRQLIATIMSLKFNSEVCEAKSRCKDKDYYRCCQIFACIFCLSIFGKAWSAKKHLTVIWPFSRQDLFPDNWYLRDIEPWWQPCPQTLRQEKQPVGWHVYVR